MEAWRWPPPIPESYAARSGPIYAADVNGDGLPDIIVGDPRLGVLLDVDGGLTPNQPLIATEFGSVVAIDVGDLNRDGIPDVLVGMQTDAGIVLDEFLGLGGGRFSPAAGAGVAARQRLSGGVRGLVQEGTVFLTDLNLDGFPTDIIAADYSEQKVWVLLHGPDGGYQASSDAFPGNVVAAAVPRAGAAPDLVVGYSLDPA